MQYAIDNTPPCFVVACCKKKHVFSLADVVRLEARSNYTVIHSLGRRPLTVAKVLCGYEAVLLQTGFVRIHRSHLVNRRHVQAVDEAGRILLCDDLKVTVPRRKRREVMEKLREEIAT